MADTLTNNLSMTKPEVGGSEDSWGTKFNANLDAIDAIFAANGSGTSVGLHVGDGKTLLVEGTLQLTGGLINADAATAAPWLWNSEATVSGGADLIPRFDSRGNLILTEDVIAGTWDSDGGTASFATSTSSPPTVTPLYGTEWRHGAIMGGNTFWGLLYNGYYSGGSTGSLKSKFGGQSWMQVFTPTHWWLGSNTNLSVGAGQELTMRWTYSINNIGSTSSYINWGLSDLREKSELRKIDNPLARVRMLNGYTYNMARMGEQRVAGLIAQELQQPNALPEAVQEGDCDIDESGDSYRPLLVNMHGPVALLVEAVKALEDRLIALEGRL